MGEKRLNPNPFLHLLLRREAHMRAKMADRKKKNNYTIRQDEPRSIFFLWMGRMEGKNCADEKRRKKNGLLSHAQLIDFRGGHRESGRRLDSTFARSRIGPPNDPHPVDRRIGWGAKRETAVLVVMKSICK